ncbi:MAG: M1 family metallopeptidase [Bacteroidota bacterium]
MKKTFIFLLSSIIGLSMSTNLLAQTGEISYMTAGGKLNPLQAIMDIRHYTIALDVDISKQEIGGYAEIELMLSKKTDTLLFDLYKKYNIQRIIVDNKTESFSKDGDSLYIINNKGFKEGRHRVRINYDGRPPIAIKPPWNGGFTWTKDKNGNPWVVINCQLEGAKVYFPCKDHPSDEPNEGVDLLITIPNDLSVAGPGLLQNVKKKGDKATWHWKTNYTISNYCVVFNIGKYKVVKKPYTTIEGNIVPIEFYVLEQDVAHADHIINLRARDTKILEKYFGEYPWVKEKIGIAQVPNPGMEHQTMVTYGDKFTFEKVGGQDYSPNLFHEFGHEWWANKVTNKDWAHMWIQEGIDTYAEALFFREVAGERGYDSLMVNINSRIRNLKPVVQGESLNMAQVYNTDVYTKGAMFMHTLRFVLGDEVFFPTLRKFITNVKFPYNEFFTTDDVAQFFSKESGRDLQPLFDFYLRTTKKLEFELHQTKLNTYTIRILNSPIDIPLDILTDKGILRVQIMAGRSQPIKISSSTQPIIDPRGWYFKKVTIP